MKKAYTLLEILLVVIIISLIGGTFGFFLPNREDAQIKYGKECSEYVYNTIQKEFQNVKKNKGERLSGNIYYPNEKVFKSIQSSHGGGATENASFIVTHFSNTGETKREILLSGGICTLQKSNKYDINLIGGVEISMKQEGFKNQLLINELQILSCEKNGETCIPISKLIFNEAAQTIQQKFCLDFSGSVCNEWEQ
ncbi:MAG TPA: type II secretion system protein [Candidatus Absconditabacterales bacterium]|nr:type II secretion system protein [Candidatus Absconditabacterales bacterium]